MSRCGAYETAGVGVNRTLRIIVTGDSQSGPLELARVLPGPRSHRRRYTRCAPAPASLPPSTMRYLFRIGRFSNQHLSISRVPARSAYCAESEVSRTYAASCRGGASCATDGLSVPAGDRELPRCRITNDHMNCGSQFPPKRRRSFPILAVMPTLKLAGALQRQAMIPWRGTGALSRRRSRAGRAGAHPCSTPYSVEQADPDSRPLRANAVALADFRCLIWLSRTLRIGRRGDSAAVVRSSGKALTRHGKSDEKTFRFPFPRDVSPKLACHRWREQEDRQTATSLPIGGGATGGYPRSDQVMTTFPARSAQWTLICPAVEESAPYFTEFVANSCSSSCQAGDRRPRNLHIAANDRKSATVSLAEVRRGNRLEERMQRRWSCGGRCARTVRQS